jgi:tetratricopeptide (TPR) repeat protein
MLRSAGVLAAVGATLQVARQFGAGASLAAVVGLVLVWLLSRVVVPRAAHRAFRTGSFRRASGLYAGLAALRLDPAARAGARVSRAACAIGRGDLDGALRLLAGDRPDDLPEAVRAAWLNNHAYAQVRSGQEPTAALALAEQAVALRPDVPGFRHSRAIALLAVGRIDDAIRELDAVWQRVDVRDEANLLEAERCFDLGEAWLRKGEAEYAADYFDRARRQAPASHWAEKALQRLSPGLRGEVGLAELL